MGAIRPYKESVCKHCNDGAIRKTIGGLCFEEPYHYQKNQQAKQRIKQNGKAKRTVKIKPISKNRLEALKRYRRLRDKYFEEHPVCEYPGCTSRDITLHHQRGRVGSFLTDKRYFKSLCWKHHEFVEQNPDVAKRLGLSLSRVEVVNIDI